MLQLGTYLAGYSSAPSSLLACWTGMIICCDVSYVWTLPVPALDEHNTLVMQCVTVLFYPGLTAVRYCYDIPKLIN